MCINPTYPNMFMKYEPLSYEQVADAAGYVQPTDYLYTTDDKSGYWQLPVHPDMWQYLAVEWQGTLYYWPSLPFGVAPACYIYTSLKRELFRPVRQAGVRLSFLIDDHAAAARSLAAAKYQCRTVVMLMAALGFTLSWSKCQFIPQPTAKFLGFIINAPRQAFEVPEGKVAAFAALLEQLRAAPKVSMRQVAQVAGKIMSMSIAVSRAPLHARVVGRALAGVTSWEEAVGSPAEVLAEAELFLELLRTKNGRTWWAPQAAIALRVAGDASDRAFAAFLPGGELGAQVMRAPFSPEELQLMAAGKFSSAARELTAIKHAVVWIQQQAPHLIRGATLQYQTDSQVAQCCILGQKGNAVNLPIVAAIYRSCAQTDTDIQVCWFPRDAPQQQLADAHSKQVRRPLTVVVSAGPRLRRHLVPPGVGLRLGP